MSLLQVKSITELRINPFNRRKEEEEVTRKLSACRKEIETKQNRELDVERKVNATEKQLNAVQQEKLLIEKQQQESVAMEKR